MGLCAHWNYYLDRPYTFQHCNGHRDPISLTHRSESKVERAIFVIRNTWRLNVQTQAIFAGVTPIMIEHKNQLVLNPRGRRLHRSRRTVDDESAGAFPSIRLYSCLKTLRLGIENSFIGKNSILDLYANLAAFRICNGYILYRGHFLGHCGYSFHCQKTT